MEQLKKLIKKKQYAEIVTYLLSVSDHSMIKQMISFLKKKELFISRYESTDFNEYIELLKQGDWQLSSYASEIECINLIFAEERKMQSSIKSIRKNERLSDVLYCLDGIYSHFLRKNKNLKPRKGDNQDPGIFLDGLAVIYNSTFKSLLYDNDIWQENAFKYQAHKVFFDNSSMKKCNEYIGFSAVSHTWDDLFENWKNCFVSIEKKEDRIVIQYIETPHLLWLRKSKSKLQIYEYIQEAELAHAVKACPTYFSNELTDFNELLAWGTLKSYLHTDDIYTLIDDVPIIYWIKAYAALIRYAKRVNFINSFRGFFLIRALLSKWLLVRSSDEWIELFTQVGIPVECANKIFDSLTYSKKSSDLYDFPLVRTKNKYMIVPALLNVAHPGKLLKSRFRQNDFNISHKGKLFEKEIVDMLKQHNIPVVQVHRRYAGKDYECDIVFLLDDTLFLCECKDNGDKYLYDYVAEFYENDVAQMERICSFFETRTDIICEEFNKIGYSNIRFKKVQKLLIYNTVFHSILKVKNINIVDYERFVAVFRRGNLDKRICDLYGGPLDCLFGRVTADKLMRYLKSELLVCDYDKIIKLKTGELPFGALTIENQVEQCTNIDREEIFAIMNPQYYEFKNFLEQHGSKFD